MMEKQLNNIKIRSRKGIAMIELIFAIVIIGITLMSIPNLIYQASESGYTTIQQESIAAAASDLSLILSREWDENGTDPSIGSPILATGGTASLENRSGAKSRSYATGIGGEPLNASTSLTREGDNIDDIDDLNGITGKVTLIAGDDEQDLIDVNITITTTVDYIEDNLSIGTDWNTSSTLSFNTLSGTSGGITTNIKRVSITLETNSTVEELADKKIIFNAFSCNIGSYKLERRVFE